MDTKEPPKKLSFSEAITEGAYLARFDPGLDRHFLRLPSGTLTADAAGLAVLGCGSLKPADAGYYIPSNVWNMTVKVRLWRRYPQLGLPWQKSEPKVRAWETLLKMHRHQVPLDKIIAWVQALGG